jgi:hypothetical protein
LVAAARRREHMGGVYGARRGREPEEGVQWPSLDEEEPLPTPLAQVVPEARREPHQVIEERFGGARRRATSTNERRFRRSA